MHKFRLALIGALTTILAAGAIAQVKDDEIANAVFAEVTPAETADIKTRAVGIAYQGVPGFGLVYDQKVAANRTAWIRGAYFIKNYLFLEEYSPSPEVAHVDIYKTNEVQLAIGVDQDFAIPSSRRWKFVLGVGVGVDQSKYKSSYYRQLCTFYCGFDPRHPLIQNQVDTYGLILGTIGLRVLETKAWGLEAKLKIAVNPTLARTGNMSFKGPDGRQFDPVALVPYTVEALVVF